MVGAIRGCREPRRRTMPDFDDDEYESFDLEGPGDGTAEADDSEAELDEPDLDEGDEDDVLEDAAPD
jgi:hypothetical protein